MPNLKFLLTTFLLFIFFTSFSQTEDIYKASTIPEQLKIKANAVVRLSDLDISIDARDELVITEKRIVTVLNEKGNSEIQAYAGFDDYTKIKDIEARIYDESGSEIKKVKERDFIDQSAVDGGTLYSDSRILYLSYLPVSYPYTVEFNCTIKTPNTAGLPSWRPISGYFVSVQKATYTLKDNANLGLRYKEKNLDKFNIKATNSENELIYTLENAMSAIPEDYSPSFSKITPQVLVASENFHFYGVDGNAKNWSEFGDWVNNSLLKGRNIVTEETKRHIINLTGEIEDPIEKAKKVFEYVQNNTRYISVQVGIGGVQPISALEVDQLKYGDCKGLTNYTQSLLEVAGVKSYYSVVQAGREIVDLEEDFASLEQGNHIILAIPDKEDLLWVDCTSQIHPFNFIGDFTDNRNVLVVKPEASEIIKTTIYPDSLNYQSTSATVKLKSNGSISSHVERKTYGLQYDSRFSIESQAPKDVIEFYKESWSYVNNLEVSNYSFNNDASKIEFTELVDVHANKFASIIGDKLLFKPNVFNQNSLIPNRYINRKLPVEISRGYLDEDNFVFTLPEDYEVEALPDKIFINNKFGEYMLEIKRGENTLVYIRKLFIKSGAYPSTEYNDYRDFRKQVARGDNSKIVLKQSSN